MGGEKEEGKGKIRNTSFRGLEGVLTNFAASDWYVKNPNHERFTDINTRVFGVCEIKGVTATQNTAFAKTLSGSEKKVFARFRKSGSDSLVLFLIEMTNIRREVRQEPTLEDDVYLLFMKYAQFRFDEDMKTTLRSVESRKKIISTREKFLADFPALYLSWIT